MKADAMAELSTLKQNKDIVDILNAKFTALMVEAKETNGMAMKEIYKNALNKLVKARIFSMETMPKTLDEWMTKAAIFDNQWQWMIASKGSKVQKNPRSTFFKKKGRSHAILTKQEKEEYRKNGKCFNYGE